MSHKNEAERLLELALTEAQDGNFESYRGFVVESQAHALIALTEAQEAANELKRIEILTAIAVRYMPEGVEREAHDALSEPGEITVVRYDSATAENVPYQLETRVLTPRVRAALGIGGDA